MNQTFPPDEPKHPSPLGAGGSTTHAHGASAQVDAIVAGAAAVVAPPPASRSERRRANRVAKQRHHVHAPQRHASRHTSGGSRRSSSTMTMLVAGLVGLLALGAVALLTGAIQLSPPGSGPTDIPGGSDRDGSWSYYHDRDYDTTETGAKWDTDRSRSSDPDEAALGNTSRWEYDGPYRYGPYGSDGMRRRAAGRESADPLYSQPSPSQDVFRQYGGNLDPSGGQPVGVAPSSMTNPYYDPYAGYSNPYSNRIRLAYGEGVGRGASYDPLG